MTTTNDRRATGWPSLRTTARLALATMVGAFVATAAFAQSTATFTLVDKTNLASAGPYQIYVTGFSTAGPNGSLILQQDGSWAVPAPPNSGTVSGTRTLPCYRFSPGMVPAPPDAISQIQINSADLGISARVYYFIVTDTTTFPNCNPASGNFGLFNNSQAFTYIYTYPATYPAQPLPQPSIAVTEPSTTFVAPPLQSFPAWTYSEIGTSASSGTIDLSQVDFFAFPMNTTSTVSSGPAAIGNPVGSTANPGEVVNNVSIRDSYRSYITAQAAKTGQTCKDASPPSICNYLELLQNVTTATSTVPQYVIQNPGGYLAQHTPATIASPLNNVFGSVTPVASAPGTYTANGVIGQLWSTTVPPTTPITYPPTVVPGTGTLTINSGGTLGGVGGVPPDDFTSKVVVIAYPGVTPAYPVNAMMFTGTAASGGYIAYVVSPADYQVGCATLIIPNCVNAGSTGYQVFAGAGAFNTPAGGTYAALTIANLLSSTAGNYNGNSGYYAVVARLGFLISGAMNRGVALVNCNTQTAPIVPQNIWRCWQDETYWYPTTVSSTFPDLTQNQFSRWMHTATIGSTPMFLQPANYLQPPNPVNSASSTPGGGKPQGMAYGFSNDENPTPTATASAQPEVPSKFDGTVAWGSGSSYTITFGPWVTAPTVNPTLTVIALGRGVVTSTPAGINCGDDCSQAYPTGTVVTLTAAPDRSAIFHGWSGGGCTGRSLTCMVTMNGTTTVTAEFYSIFSSTPAQYGLHTLVSGNGTVTSVPAGIVCGNECSTAFNVNTVVTLTAAAGANSLFAKWTGACSGSGPTCTVTMTDAKTVGAAFVNSAQVMLSVTTTAGGIVTTLPGGIDCGTRCTAGFAPGAYVNIVATPNHGYRFAGWSGACSGASTCDVTMTGNMAVQATFAPIAVGHYSMTVHDFGEGTIVSSPAGINCGSACSAAFVSGTKVTLVATPAAGYRFAGWSGSCTGTGACVVWMDDLANAYAFFDPVAVPVASEPIPTLSEWSMALMALLMLVVGFMQMRKRAMLRR